MVISYVYSHTPKTLAALQDGVSTVRLGKYLSFSSGDTEKALELHSWNSALGASLHSPIQHFEIVFRNACHRELEILYSRSDWFNALPKTKRYDFLNGEIIKLQKKLVKAGRNPNNPPCVVAGLNFGFWNALFVRQFDRELWYSGLSKTVPNFPAGLFRHDFYHRIDRIRALRNRIAHHEPIFHRNLISAHSLIVDTTSYICADSAMWISHHSQFSTIFFNPPSLTVAEMHSLQQNQNNDTYYN